MAKNSKVANYAVDDNVELSTKNNLELVPIESTNSSGEMQETSLLTKETEIATEDYQKYLTLAGKLSEYNPTISIASKYYEFTKPGESVRGVFLGTTFIKKKDDNTKELIELECVQWLAEDGSLYLNAGAALISIFRQFLPPKGCPIEITYESKKERTKIYDVRVLTA